MLIQFGNSILYFDHLKWKFGRWNLDKIDCSRDASPWNVYSWVRAYCTLLYISQVRVADLYNVLSGKPNTSLRIVKRSSSHFFLWGRDNKHDPYHIKEIIKMENTHTFFATPNNIQADCFYAHHLLEDGTFEQLGFSENFIHITTIKSTEVQSDWFLQNERVISSDQYVQIISIIKSFLVQTNELFDCPSLPFDRTDIHVGSTFIYNNRIGSILSITKERICLGGIQRNNDNNFSAFMTFLTSREVESMTIYKFDSFTYQEYKTKYKEILQQLKSCLSEK